MSNTWSYSAGKRGLNRVRVYERSPGSPLWIKWSNDHNQPERRSLRVVADRPIYDREVAVMIADRAALRIKESTTVGRDLRELLGLEERHTLEELFTEYWDVHTSEKEGEGWSDKYETDQARHRDFWYEKLGRDRYLRDVTPAEVEKAVKKTAEERDWEEETKRKYLVFLKSAFNWAESHLKWISGQETLTQIELPDPDPDQPDYEPKELFQILDAADQVDLRSRVHGEICTVTLRRLNAVRQTRLEHLEERMVGGERRMVISFPGETDKSGKTAYTVLPERSAEVVQKLADKPAVQATGLLFPRGNLEDGDPPEENRRPVGKKKLNTWWHDAEKKAGVPWEKKRALHGIKRTMVTLADARNLIVAASEQSNTDVETLRHVYVKGHPDKKCELADAIERERETWRNAS